MKNRQLLALRTFCLFICAVVFSGCEKPASNIDGNESEQPLPKLHFHKPSHFGAAVVRIREIHHQLTSREMLPAPISYTVREVHHAHGSGESHLHYELVDEREQPHGHKHEHSDHNQMALSFPTPKHQVVVDVFTELTDVVRWLPAIAADSDMQANDWTQVEEITKEVSGQLEAMNTATLPSDKHAIYRSRSDTIEASIKELETLVKAIPAKLLD